MHPLYKLVAFLSLTLFFLSCEKEYKTPFFGEWETVKLSYLIDGVQQPESERKGHWNFQENQLIMANQWYQSFDTISAYYVTADSLIYEPGNGYKYGFSGDTLILSYHFGSTDECTDEFKLYLLRLGDTQFGDFSENFNGIEGDWSEKECYLYHPDSTDQIKNYYRNDKDLVITMDSIFTMDYPWHFLGATSYNLKNDSLRIKDIDSIKQVAYFILDDTLVLEEYSKEGYFIRKKYIRDNYDRGNVQYLIENRFDNEVLLGKWTLLLNEKDRLLFIDQFPDYRFLHILEYRRPCKSNDLNQTFSFDKDLISIEENGSINQFQFTAIWPHTGGCIPTFEIVLTPIIDGKSAEIGFTYSRW